MKIAITGANGYIGTYLSSHLSEKGLDVCALVRVSSAFSKTTLFKACKVDFDNIGSITSALTDCDVVVHLIAKTHGQGGNDLQDYLAINRDIAVRVANAAIKAGATTFIYISSVKAVAESSEQGRPLTHSTPPSPEDNYGRSKLSAEQALQELTANSAMMLFIIRPPLVWGDEPKGNLATILKWAHLGLPLPLGGIHNLRDWVSLENLAEFISHLIDNHDNIESDTFFVSDNNPLSTSKAVSTMLVRANMRPRLYTIPHWIWRSASAVPKFKNTIKKITGNLQLDICDTTQKTGWKPRSVQIQ